MCYDMRETKWVNVYLVIEGTDKEIQDFYVLVRDLNELIYHRLSITNFGFVKFEISNLH